MTSQQIRQRNIALAWGVGVTLTIGYVATACADVSDHKKACAPANAATVKKAMTDAKAALQLAVESFNNASPAVVAKQIKWFGPLNSSTASQVQKVYQTSLAMAPFTSIWCPVQNNLDFAWNPGDVAAVHPDEPAAIFITPKFFSLKSTGANSQRGVIVHELTHVISVGLDPEVYGLANAKRLAKDEPVRARMNSDNYMYYIEDLIFGLQ